MSGTPSTPYNRRPQLRRATPRQRGYLPTSSIPANAIPVIPPMQLFRLDPNNNPEGAPPIQNPPRQGNVNNNGNANGGRRHRKKRTIRHKRKTHRRKSHRRKTHRR